VQFSERLTCDANNLVQELLLDNFSHGTRSILNSSTSFACHFQLQPDKWNRKKSMLCLTINWKAAREGKDFDVGWPTFKDANL
jgi:hypothetical protein